MEWKEYLSSEQLAQFKRKSNAKAFAMVLANWGAIFALFALAYLFPPTYLWANALVTLLVVVLLAGRQLGLAVLMHDAGHNLLFESKRLNQFVGQWLCANPILQDLPSYAKGHLQHHKFAGTEQDPDLGNYQNYPVSKESFRRKVIRDLTGQTGWKLLKFVLRSAAQVLHKEQRKMSYPYLQEFFIQGILLGILTLTMGPWLYLLWAASWMTVYMLLVRLRQVAEHAAVEDLFDTDPRKNTRTTIPNWLERMCIAPNYVNYHVEHHFLASVPCYQLPALHRHLRSKGAYTTTNIAQGYRQVLREAIQQ